MPEPAPTRARTTTRSRQRFVRRQWARRWLTWKYVVVAALLLGLVLGGIWLVLFSSYLAVQSVEVTGTTTLRAGQVLAAAAVPDGKPLARIDLGAIQARVESLAAVKSADVSRAWPARVLIVIEERVAVAVVEIGGQLRGLDASGVVFGDYSRAPAGLPRVQAGAGAGAGVAVGVEALQEAAQVIVAMPSALSARVDHVEVVSVDQISLVLRDGRLVVWGSADQSAEKARVLEALLMEDARVYNVSVPGQVTTTP